MSITTFSKFNMVQSNEPQQNKTIELDLMYIKIQVALEFNRPNGLFLESNLSENFKLFKQEIEIFLKRQRYTKNTCMYKWHDT